MMMRACVASRLWVTASPAINATTRGGGWVFVQMAVDDHSRAAGAAEQRANPSDRPGSVLGDVAGSRSRKHSQVSRNLNKSGSTFVPHRDLAHHSRAGGSAFRRILKREKETNESHLPHRLVQGAARLGG